MRILNKPVIVSITGIIFKRTYMCIFHSFETGNCVSTTNFKQIKKEIAAQLSGIKLIFYSNKKNAVAHLIYYNL